MCQSMKPVQPNFSHFSQVKGWWEVKESGSVSNFDIEDHQRRPEVVGIILDQNKYLGYLESNNKSEV